jgi:hypothetical protein
MPGKQAAEKGAGSDATSTPSNYLTIRDAGFPMGFQSIFVWKALPEAAFVKKAVIDAHRSKHESIASGWLHRSARPILPQASPVLCIVHSLVRNV